MIKYTLDLPPDLRQAIDLQAAKELQVSPADVARRWLQTGRVVQESLEGDSLPGFDLDEIVELVKALLAGQMTYSEGVYEVSKLIRRACQATRATVEAEWSGYNDRDTR